MKNRLAVLPALVVSALSVSARAEPETVAIPLGEKGPVLEMVKTPDGLWFGKFEVTQAQWRRVTGSRKSGGRAVDEGDDKPVVGVSAGEVSSFLSRLNAMEPVRKSGLSFRLPTADEWTTACRAGGTGAWPLGADGREGSLDAMAWHRARPRSGFDLADPLRPVGTKAPNAYGLYDMLGNAEEMTATTVRIDDRFAGTVQGNVWCGGGVNFRPRPEPIENDFLGPQDDDGMNFRDGCLARRSLEGPLNQGGFRLCAGGTASGVSTPAPSVRDPAVRQTPSAAPAPGSAPPSAPGGASAPDSAAARARQQAVELINAGDLAGAQAFLDLARSLENGTSAPAADKLSQPAPGTRKVIRVGSVEFAVRWCPAGKDVPNGFWMGETEVTQRLWKQVAGSNPSHFPKGGDYPVEQVSWNDCQTFLDKINDSPGVRSSGLVFRLPTEAEWIHACRAGATGIYGKLSDGTEITRDTWGWVAWFKDNSGGKTHPVGQKKSNVWGLYDMHGNVDEWTSTADGMNRVNYGDGYYTSAGDCNRFKYPPSMRIFFLGFRLCASGRAD